MPPAFNPFEVTSVLAATIWPVRLLATTFSSNVVPRPIPLVLAMKFVSELPPPPPALGAFDKSKLMLPALVR